MGEVRTAQHLLRAEEGGAGVRCIEDMAEKVPGLKTWEGARRRLARVLSGELGRESLSVIVHKADGTFVPVAILGDRDMYLAFALANNGVLVASPR